MKKGCAIVVAAVVVLVIAIGLCSGPSEEKPAAVKPTELSPTATSRATDVPVPTATPEKVMYLCAMDRCTNSGAYGEIVSDGEILIWEGPDPNRGRVLRHAQHHDRVIIVDEVILGDYIGEHWYELKSGGWTNGFWLTEEPCTEENLEKYSHEC